MSEKQDSIQHSPAPVRSQSKGHLTLLKALIILVVIYGAGEVSAQFVALKAPAAIPWMELSQWVLIVLWLLVGVRPPFMRWVKRQREHRE